MLTSKRDRGPSRDWLAVVKTTRARNKIKQWFKAESREDTEHTGRDLLQEHLRKAGLPAQKITGSPLLADVIREMGFRKADDFYIALGGAKISPKVVVNKVLQRLKQGEAAEADRDPVEELVSSSRPRRQPTGASSSYGIKVDGVDDVMLRLAKCCRPVPGDPIVGYVSLGRGITIHRDDCPNTAALRKDPERFVRVHWEGEHEQAFRVELQIDAWDRHRLLEDLSRTLAEHGINIVEARCIVSGPMVKNRFVVEVADTSALKGTVTRLRNIDAVFDATASPPARGRRPGRPRRRPRLRARARPVVRRLLGARSTSSGLSRTVVRTLTAPELFTARTTAAAAALSGSSQIVTTSDRPKAKSKLSIRPPTLSARWTIASRRADPPPDLTPGDALRACTSPR